MNPILTNTYFSGAGLMDIGLQAGGLTLQQSFEIEAVCCDTHAAELLSRSRPVRHHKEARSVGKGMPRDGGDLSVHKVFTDR